MNKGIQIEFRKSITHTQYDRIEARVLVTFNGWVLFIEIISKGVYKMCWQHTISSFKATKFGVRE